MRQRRQPAEDRTAIKSEGSAKLPKRDISGENAVSKAFRNLFQLGQINPGISNGPSFAYASWARTLSMVFLLSLSIFFLGRLSLKQFSGDPCLELKAFSIEQLAQFDGRDGRPIYVGLYRRVYEVTHLKEYYGPGRSLHRFAGRDATRSFATGCVTGGCLSPSLEGLTRAEAAEAERWRALFRRSPEHRCVGHISGGAAPAASAERVAAEDVVKGLSASELDERASQRLAEGSPSDANALWLGALIRLGEPHRGVSEADASFRARILLRLAGAANSVGDLWQAGEHSKEALDGIVASLGPEAAARHPMAARASSDQAVLLFAQGEFLEAAGAFRRALSAYSGALAGADEEVLREHGGRLRLSEEAADTRFRLALSLKHAGDVFRAVEEARGLLGSFSGDAETSPAIEESLESAWKIVQEIEDLYDREYQEGGFDDLY